MRGVAPGLAPTTGRGAAVASPTAAASPSTPGTTTRAASSRATPASGAPPNGASLRKSMVQAKAFTMTLATRGRNRLLSIALRRMPRARRREGGGIGDRQREDSRQQREPQRVPDDAEVILRAEKSRVSRE
ncbi:MAG: hypothetical protein ABR970_03515 [Roseiarcus sp.]